MDDFRNVDYSLLGDEHVRRYRETGGDIGYDWNGAPVLLLTTTGRRSGAARTTPLIFGRDRDNYLVVASVGGSPRHPAWYLNLEADPHASIQVRGDHHDVVARTATPEEKPQLWRIMNDVWPNYDAYQSRTERDIPVVVLTPQDASAEG
jgi:deazaflavin-dependent oxidoreductase (nitroreductase family)